GRLRRVPVPPVGVRAPGLSPGASRATEPPHTRGAHRSPRAPAALPSTGRAPRGAARAAPPLLQRRQSLWRPAATDTFPPAPTAAGGRQRYPNDDTGRAPHDGVVDRPRPV